VYETEGDEEEGEDFDRSSGTSFRTKSGYDSRFPSTTTTLDEDILRGSLGGGGMHPLGTGQSRSQSLSRAQSHSQSRRLSAQHTNSDDDIAHGRDDDADLVRNLNADLMQEQETPSPNTRVSRHRPPPVVTANTRGDLMSDDGEMIEETVSVSVSGTGESQGGGGDDFDSSLLSEQFAARIPGSVFTQNSGHLSAHNLLRISSVGSDWEVHEDEEMERERENEDSERTERLQPHPRR
jgi:hypothetical protein